MKNAQEEEESGEKVEAYLIPTNLSSESSWKSMIGTLTNIRRIATNPAIIPDRFKQHPTLFYLAIAAMPLLFLLFIRWQLILFLTGIILGYLIGVPSLIPTIEGGKTGPLLPKWMDDLKRAILTPLRIKSKEHHEYSKLNISPAIDAELDGLLNALLREVVDAWFVPLCMSGERDFQSCLRSVINASIMNFLRYGKSINADILTLIMYGLTNATIVHMEEFRAFEDSHLPLDKFLRSGKTIRRHYESFLEELGHVKQIVALLLKRLLPKQESRSILVNALLKEILSGNMLVGVIDKLSDPDFINEMIVKHLGKVPKGSIPLEPGYDLVTIKVLGGRNLPFTKEGGGLYLVLHVAGLRSKTRRISSFDQLWNETFLYKVPSNTRGKFKAYLQLYRFHNMQQDELKGIAKFVPEMAFEANSTSKTLWVAIQSKDSAENAAKLHLSPEILIEYSIEVGPSSIISEPVSEEEESNIELDVPPPEMEIDAPENTANAAVPPPTEISEEHGMISFDAALQNNELFMELLEFMESLKAPPYLQFLMNVDALRQFTSMSLGVDNRNMEAIETYFRTGLPLNDEQTSQLKVIKHDTVDVYNNHFTDNAKYRIPLDPGMQKEIQDWVAKSDLLDEERRFVGGRIGADIFAPAYEWVASLLRDVYFPKFKSSASFNRFLDRSKIATLSFPIEEDRISIYSQDSNALTASEGPHYGGLRSRNNSFDDLREIQLKDGDEELQKIAAEITLTRRKLLNVRERISEQKDRPNGGSNSNNNTSDFSSISKLVKEERALRSQVSNLMEIATQLENKAKIGRDDFYPDLSGAQARVAFEAEEGPVSSLLTGMGNVLGVTGEQSFLVTIVANDGAAYQVRRSYSEFARLHGILQSKFPKVRKLQFPEQGIVFNEGLDQGLQAYLSLLLSDEFIRQSEKVKEFLILEAPFEDADRTTLSSVKKGMADAFRSATSLFTTTTTPLEGGRSRFYDTRERHSSLGFTDTRQSVERPPILKVPSTQETPEKPKHAGKSKKLSKIPSVELPSMAETPSPEPSDEIRAAFVRELSESDIEMLVETLFAFIIETFDLREPNQWLRRKLLGAFKQLMKQAYGDTLNKLLTTFLNSMLKDTVVCNGLKVLKGVLFPDGVFIGKRPPPTPRTREQRFALMVEARTAFLKRVPDILLKLAGRYNAVCGMTRIFNSLQHKELNKALVFAYLDILVKLTFAEQTPATSE